MNDPTKWKQIFGKNKALYLYHILLVVHASLLTACFDWTFPTCNPDGSCNSNIEVDSDAGMDASSTDPDASTDDTSINIDDISFQGGPDVDITASPLVIEQQQVSYIQSPIGNAASEDLLDDAGNTVFTISTGIAFYELGPSEGLQAIDRLQANTFLLANNEVPESIRIWGTPIKQNLLGSARLQKRPNETYWSRADLQLDATKAQDVSQIWVTGVDTMGQESEATLVHNNWFIGSTAQTPNSPHELKISPKIEAPLALEHLINPTPENINGTDAISQVINAEYTWNRRVAGVPSIRAGHAMAFDSLRGKTILFGGHAEGSTEFGDTWIWDGFNWNIARLSGEIPPIRRHHSMTFDSQRGQIILFGGLGEDGPLNDTWIWNGSQWSNVTPTNNNPPARSLHRITYDASRGHVVLFGGLSTDTEQLNDTWTWNGSQWTEVTPPSNNPPAREAHAMVFDSQRAQLILFGGRSDNQILDDTWIWDGSQWTEVTPNNSNPQTPSPPPARIAHQMAFDNQQNQVVLFGGSNGDTSEFYNDLWTWNGSTWELIQSALNPSTRSSHALVYDNQRKQLLLFGGFRGETSYLDDTWIWNGSQWIDVTPSKSLPTARSRHGMTFDNQRESIVLFGGFDGSTRLNDTWNWNGYRWINNTPVGTNPSSRNDTAIAFDRQRNQVVLFGGYDGTNRLNDTWVWDGIRWLELSPNLSPNARDTHSMVYDVPNAVILLFGGFFGTGIYNDTWSWNGTTWNQVIPGINPPARRFPRMVFDQQRRNILLFGGYDGTETFADTWLFNNLNWTEIFPTTIPAQRDSHAITYDSKLGQAILFGGSQRNDNTQNTNIYLNDTWIWNGSNWRPLQSTAINPPGLWFPDMSFDSVRENVVLFGGEDNNQRPTNQTWVLSLPEKPTAQLSFKLPPQISKSNISDLHVRAYCGGSSQTPTNQQINGAHLLAWDIDKSDFEVLATNEANINELKAQNAFLEFRQSETHAPQEVPNLFRETMYFRCEPVGSSRTINAQLSVDYIEVRVKYTSTTELLD